MKAWEEFLKRLENDFGVETIRKWLRSLKILRYDACNLYLEAKDTFQALWFEEHIRPKVIASFFNNNNKRIKVHLKIGTAPSDRKKDRAVKPKNNAVKEELSITFNDPDPLSTFDNFIVTENNLLPYKLFKESPASFNPVYLYGKPGSGKTHLLMALANSLRSQGLKVQYVRAETFTEHVVSAIRAGAMALFRQAYRTLDAFIIDDVHLFAKKNATQEEFFHTFNTLHMAGKQIYLSANCAPSELSSIEPRLVSRFEWGIVLPLEVASTVDLPLLLKKKAESLHYPLQPKVAEFLIEVFKSSPKAMIRALEALILRSHINEEKSLTFKQMSVPLAKHYLSDLLLAESQSQITPEKIIKFCAEHYGIRTEDILGKAQKKECAQPRQVAMYLCRNQLKYPFTKIGDLFSRDHSTVMTSVKLIQKLLDERDTVIEPAISAITKKLH
ncbi:Chromosomal replication initiator protein DnaA 1 [Chlamydiales bacterium STE3]|nr:Chromosomal replication initiator protein DnaA 1 [Chlamydiales bacterium STE3]